MGIALPVFQVHLWGQKSRVILDSDLSFLKHFNIVPKSGSDTSHYSCFCLQPPWLLLFFRTDFKMLLYIFKSLLTLAAAYINDLLTPYSLALPLRSTNLLLVKARLQTEGDWAFQEYFWNNPWNNLLPRFRQVLAADRLLQSWEWATMLQTV